MSTTDKKEPSFPRVGILMQADRGYERGLLRGIARYARLHGPWQFYRRLPEISGGIHQGLPEIGHWHPDGWIVREGQHAGFDITRINKPCLYAPSTERMPGLPNILGDDDAIGRMAAEHLMECGLTHFAYCGLDYLYFWSRDRRDAFCRELEKNGFSAAIYRRKWQGAIHWNRELEVLAAWIRDLPEPIGIMACNDDFTLLVTEACKIAGRSVPQDVAILGVGNDEAICDLASVSISSIAFGTEQAGYQAAELLAKLMRDPTADYNDIIVEPHRVIQRHSTDILDISDRSVALAVRYIRDHASQPIAVDDVVRAVPLSRRALYDRFKRVTRHTIYEYITQTRLESFTRLLLDTNLTISEISNSMGFSDEKNISRYFRRVKGMTPLAYRRKHSTVFAP